MRARGIIDFALMSFHRETHSSQNKIAKAHNSDLENPTEGNGELTVVQMRWLEAITSHSETSYGYDNVLLEVFTVDRSDPVFLPP